MIIGQGENVLVITDTKVSSFAVWRISTSKDRRPSQINNMQAQGHSRKETDDFSNILFGDDGENLENGENFLNDPSVEPTLTFRQPKPRFSSFDAALGSIFRLCQKLAKVLLKVYIHPVSSAVILILALGIPILLAVTVFKSDFKRSKEYIKIDKSLDSFEIPGHKSAEREDTFAVARKLSKVSKGIPSNRRKRRSADMPPLLPSTKPPPAYQHRMGETLDLVYVAIGDDEQNIFTKERLETIHEIEKSLMNQEDFGKYCWKWSGASFDPVLKCLYNGCTPPISLIDFFFPSRVLNTYLYDGQGRQLEGDVKKCQFVKTNLTEHGIKSTLKLLLSRSLTYWFVDQSFSADNQKSKFLRAQLKFGLPPDGIHSLRYGKTLSRKYLFKYVEAVKKMSTDKVQVLYGGTSIFDHEVEATLWADLKLTYYTIAFIGVFVLVFTGFSLFLTVCSTSSILASLFLAYYFFRVVFDKESVGILSGVSVFIIIGIGVDDVFVFINTFRQAHNAKSLEVRLLNTICTAGKATFFTSFTTGAAFAANCISKIPAIRDFGLFMALIVSCCWCTVFVILPPALNLWYRYFSHCEAYASRYLCSLIPCSFGCANSGLPDNIIQFLSGNSSSHVNETSQASTTHIELNTRISAQADSDSLLVQLDSSPAVSQNPSPTSSDIDLALFDDPNGTFDVMPLMHHRTTPPAPVLVEGEPSAEGCNLGFGLQSFLYQWLGIPVQKYRYVVLIAFCCVLITSVVLDSQIKPSTQPPAFYKKSSNLQQMLDLKYNMSSNSLNTDNVKGFLLGRDNNKVDNNDQTTNNPTESNKFETPTSQASSTVPSPQQPGHQPKTNKVEHHSGGENLATPSAKKNVPHSTSSPIPASREKSSTSKSPFVSTTKPATPLSQGNPTAKNTKTGKNTKQTALPDDSGNNIDNNTLTTPAFPTKDVCSEAGSCPTVARPIVDANAIIYVIFGLKGIDRSGITREHVIEKKGNVIPDYKFTELLQNKWHTFIKYACRLCKALSANRELVQEGGGDCFPQWFFHWLNNHPGDKWNQECSGIVSPSFTTGKSQAKLMKMPSKHKNYTYWMVMAFESNIYMGKSAKERVLDFERWDRALKDLLQADDIPDGLKSGFQTSSMWVLTFLEVIAVNSAIYGITLSLVLCVAAVAVFTANFFLTVIVMLTILGVLSTVVAIFYLASWHLGVVEAISLSILVGTSVDYCVHLVEGYILAGKALPDLNSAKDQRGWRTLAALSHIGTAILSSAVTTVAASIPLCFTIIQLFAKFGQILAINTAVSIFFTLTICMALLCIMAPAKFRSSIKHTAISFAVVMAVSLSIAFVLFMVNWKVATIPGPVGEPLFPKP